jgi:hypothetical protein
MAGLQAPLSTLRLASRDTVKAELTLPTDLAAKQRAIDAELNSAIQRAFQL